MRVNRVIPAVMISLVCGGCASADPSADTATSAEARDPSLPRPLGWNEFMAGAGVGAGTVVGAGVGGVLGGPGGSVIGGAVGAGLGSLVGEHDRLLGPPIEVAQPPLPAWFYRPGAAGNPRGAEPPGFSTPDICPPVHDPGEPCSQGAAALGEL